MTLRDRLLWDEGDLRIASPPPPPDFDDLADTTEGQKGYDPNEPRDPATGEWIKLGGATVDVGGMEVPEEFAQWSRNDDGTYSSPVPGWRLRKAKKRAEQQKPFERTTRKPDPGWQVEQQAGGTWHVRASADTLKAAKRAAARQMEFHRRRGELHQGDAFPHEAAFTGTPTDVHGDVAKAAQLLAEGKPVKLDHKREVTALLDKISALVKDAEAKGDKAPTYDLCKVVVPGTNLFCAKTKGIPRIKMPQLSGPPRPGSPADKLPRVDPGGDVDLTKQFLDHLKAKGYKVHAETEGADHLRPTQMELNGAKVAGIVKFLRGGGKLPPGRTVVSKDNYIVDGHHRWASEVALGLTGTEQRVRVDRVDIGIIDLLREALAYTNRMGIGQQSGADTSVPYGKLWEALLKDYDPNQPRDPHTGQWIDILGNPQGKGLGELPSLISDRHTPGVGSGGTLQVTANGSERDGYSVQVSGSTDTAEQADRIVAEFPKSYKVKRSGVSGVSNPLTGEDVHPGTVNITAQLRATGVTGDKNEAGAERLRKFAEKAKKLGLRFSYRDHGGNSVPADSPILKPFGPLHVDPKQEQRDAAAAINGSRLLGWRPKTEYHDPSSPLTQRTRDRYWKLVREYEEKYGEPPPGPVPSKDFGKAFNPDEPRDAHGRWVHVPGSDHLDSFSADPWASGPFQPTGGSQLDAILGSHAFAGNEARALNGYLGSTHSAEVNRALRGLSENNPEIQADVSGLDGACQNSGKVGEPIRVLRKTHSAPNAILPEFDPNHPEALIGKSYVEHGFGSTTTNVTFAVSLFGQKTGTMWEMEVAPDVQAVWGQNPDEDELLLQRDLRYTVLGVRHNPPPEAGYYGAIWPEWTVRVRVEPSGGRSASGSSGSGKALVSIHAISSAGRMDDFRLVAEEGRKAYDPNEARDPVTGRWVSTPGASDLADFSFQPDAPPSSSDATLIQDAIDEATNGETSRDLDPHPGRRVPNVGDPAYSSESTDLQRGTNTWHGYLSPSGYEHTQAVARGLVADKVTEHGLDSFQHTLIPKYGRSRKGKETWRVTSLDHMSAANKKKLKEGKSVTVKEPGLLSLGVDRASTEYVGEQTHPESRSRVELRIKVATDQKAMDSLQKQSREDDNPNLLPEYVFPRGMKLHFTGKSHIERRPFFKVDTVLDADNAEAWKVYPVTVYDVELQGP